MTAPHAGGSGSAPAGSVLLSLMLTAPPCGGLGYAPPGDVLLGDEYALPEQSISDSGDVWALDGEDPGP